MSFITKPAIILAAAAAIMLAPAARADEPKVHVTFGGGVTAGSIDGEAALNASVGYRFSKHFSFDVEVTGANQAVDNFSNRMINIGGVQIPTNIRIGSMMGGNNRGGFNFPNIGGGVNMPVQGNYQVDNNGHTYLTTVGFRYLLPTADERFRPYASGGLGVSITDENFSVGMMSTDARNPANMNTPTNLVDQHSNHTGLAASGGVGASVRVFKQLSLGVDARYFFLDRGRNLGIFGGSVSYGF